VIRVGLTGGIASGKSTVADALAERGAVIIDADVLAREVVEPGTAGLRAVQERFGPDVVRSDGSLDREGLGRIVFADPDARRDLEAIIHPAVRARAAVLAARAPDDAVVVQVIPLLVETAQQDAFDLVVVVDVEPETQLSRLEQRNGFSRAEAVARVAAQIGRADRLAAADVVIDNSGQREALGPQVDRLWAKLRDGILPA
jgi:dephospho-CoA kinase